MDDSQLPGAQPQADQSQSSAPDDSSTAPTMDAPTMEPTPTPVTPTEPVAGGETEQPASNDNPVTDGTTSDLGTAPESTTADLGASGTATEETPQPPADNTMPPVDSTNSL